MDLFKDILRNLITQTSSFQLKLVYVIKWNLQTMKISRSLNGLYKKNKNFLFDIFTFIAIDL